MTKHRVLITSVSGVFGPKNIDFMKESIKGNVWVLGVDKIHSYVAEDKADKFVIVPSGDSISYIEKICELIEANNITLVFGCGGERDFKKRPLMAKIAKLYCKKIYVTDDNPRKENPSKIRNEIINKTQLGLNISSTMNSGNLVSDNIVSDLIEIYISNNDFNDRLIFDGYPRNISQAENLNLLLKKYNKKLDLVLKLSVPIDIIKKRITGRSICSILLISTRG